MPIAKRISGNFCKFRAIHFSCRTAPNATNKTVARDFWIFSQILFSSKISAEPESQPTIFKFKFFFCKFSAAFSATFSAPPSKKIREFSFAFLQKFSNKSDPAEISKLGFRFAKNKNLKSEKIAAIKFFPRKFIAHKIPFPSAKFKSAFCKIFLNFAFCFAATSISGFGVKIFFCELPIFVIPEKFSKKILSGISGKFSF